MNENSSKYYLVAIFLSRDNTFQWLCPLVLLLQEAVTIVIVGPHFALIILLTQQPCIVYSALAIQFFNIESYHTPPSQARPGSTGGCWWGPRCSRHTQGTPDQGSLKTLANFHNLINTYVRYRNRRGCQRNVGFAIFERHSLYESLQVHLQPTPKIRRETSKNFIVQMKH